MPRVDNRRITDAEIEEVKRANPVDEVILEHGIALRREGHYLKGLCPFHPDANHPNLTVFPDRLKWRCFACEAWGDVIEFVRRSENIPFLEAFERVRARRAGPRSTQYRPRPVEQEFSAADHSQPRGDSLVGSANAHGVIRRQWDRLSLDQQIVMNIARLVYQDALWHHPVALAYVRDRAIPDWAIRQCGLGFADGHSLELRLRRRGELRLAEQLGLLRPAQGGGGCRELLAGRIVVPELRGGQCIWFIGRTIRESEGAPKYVALPGERPVLGLERVAGRREAFVCEGVFDYLTAAVWRLAACSFCGTSLPDDRLGFLAGARTIYGLFDPDPAGQAAAARAGEQLGDRFRPIPLPDGCDLSDLGRRPDGRQAFFDLLATARQAAPPAARVGPTSSDSRKAREENHAFAQ